MKKLLALALCAIMLFALAIPAIAADETGMVILPEAPKADIIIDGVKDDGYGDPYDLTKVRNDGAGATGKVWSAWNDKGVYYYIEVYDTTPNHDHANSWERDNVEFFIDWNSCQIDESSYNNVADENPCWQVRIASAPNEDGNTNSGTLGDDTLEPGKDFVAAALNGDYKNGYIIEICLPIALTEGNAKALAVGARLLVDFQIGDNQEDGGRTSQVFLDPEHELTDQQWNNPAAFRGVLPLAAAKSAPVVDEPATDGVDDAAMGGGDVPAPDVIAPPVVPPKTGDSGIIVLMAIMAAAVVVTLRKKAVR